MPPGVCEMRSEAKGYVGEHNLMQGGSDSCHMPSRLPCIALEICSSYQGIRKHPFCLQLSHCFEASAKAFEFEANGSKQSQWTP